MNARTGDLVWLQLYSPGSNKCRTYGTRRLMRLASIEPDYGTPGITRYHCADPKRPNDTSCMSWSESDWADVDLAEPRQLDIFDALADG